MKKRRKILLFLKLPPPYGGGEIINQVVFEDLKDKNDFEIFIIKSGDHSNKSTQGRINFFNIFYGLDFLIKACITVLFTHPEKIYISIPKNFISFFRNSLLICFCKIIRVKVYGDLAGMSFPFMKKRRKFTRKYGRFIFSMIDNMRILGENIKSYIPYIEPSKLTSFANGIPQPDNQSVDSSKYDAQSLNLLYVGSIESSKGFDNLINAIKLCRQNNLNVVLNVLGEWTNDEFRNKTEGIISEHELSGMILFHGLLIDKEKWEIYKRSSILIHPTKWDGQPVAILEALSMGLVIISTNIGAIPNTIQDGINGSIIETPEPKLIYDSISSYYQDRGKIKKIGLYNKEFFNNQYNKDIFVRIFSNWLLADGN